jgi:ABC-type lipoprotein export system ATPase subunit
LDGLDFSISRGERVVVMGPSGCGKTTLLHVLGGLLQPTAGTVRWNGMPLPFPGWRGKRSGFLGHVFQRPMLFPELTVEENVLFPQRILSGEKTAGLVRVRELLDSVGLGHRRTAMPWELSGGEQQRVAIARALMTRPRFLLADEPTGSLDRCAGDRVRDRLWELAAAQGTGLVVVTHNPRFIPIADRLLAMGNGKMVALEKPPAGDFPKWTGFPGGEA